MLITPVSLLLHVLRCSTRAIISELAQNARLLWSSRVLQFHYSCADEELRTWSCGAHHLQCHLFSKCDNTLPCCSRWLMCWLERSSLLSTACHGFHTNASLCRWTIVGIAFVLARNVQGLLLRIQATHQTRFECFEYTQWKITTSTIDNNGNVCEG